ncbi:DEAD/DEAH box ATP-dependent RNA helicase, putative [Plasmodium ovale wallikeri]|uniref:RNA helicase n=1 Tax=Plasmodium ovale wallikeri TaxID=864142 RepID=A0A1A8ZRM5_PLAOA|nr:DEAD/DEAH box ATP-dependent RNA helicase, putative [Plasmodium ovale wallikeri]SBT46760.1 DEAD/DEAH box ATP-dependent RNA helicase, putative [Plasmodium ovale wallikeri]
MECENHLSNFPTEKNNDVDDSPGEFSEKKSLTRKEKKKLEYEERIRKKKEKQLKKVKKIITKCNIISLKCLKSNSSIKSSSPSHGTEDTADTVLRTKDETNSSDIKNINGDQIKQSRDHINEYDNNSDEEKQILQAVEKIKNKYRNLNSLENVSKRKLMRTLKYKLKKDKDAEREVLFKKIQQYKLNDHQLSFMIPFHIKNKNQNQENLEKVLKTYEQMNIDLPNNLKIIKSKMEKKKKRFLECKKKKDLENASEKDENGKKMRVSKQLFQDSENKIRELCHMESDDSRTSVISGESENMDIGCDDLKKLNNEMILKCEDPINDVNPFKKDKSPIYHSIKEGGDQGEGTIENSCIQEPTTRRCKIHEQEWCEKCSKQNDREIREKNGEQNDYELHEKNDKAKTNEDKAQRKVTYERVNVSRKESIERMRSSLPVLGYEQEIIEAILSYDVVFINGDTGCGKSTQVPQFVYEHGFCSNNYLIGITEPRKIAVKSISNRLNEELNSNDISGYQIRFEKSNFLKNSKIKVMTEGILLREIMNDFILSKYSIIILDEAHERSINMDLILGVLSIICKIRKNNYLNHQSDIIPIKVIIMSATINDSNFFENKIFSNYVSINIPTEKVPVVDHFLSYTPKNYLEEAKKKIIQIHRKLPPGSILVFLTSQEEIYRLYNILSNLKIFQKSEENTSVREFNEEKKNVEGENSFSFDLSEDEKSADNNTGFFLRDTDENKEKKIIFEDSEEDGDGDDNNEDAVQSSLASNTNEQSKNCSSNNSEQRPEKGSSQKLRLYGNCRNNDLEEGEENKCNENDMQIAKVDNKATTGNVESSQNGNETEVVDVDCSNDESLNGDGKNEDKGDEENQDGNGENVQGQGAERKKGSIQKDKNDMNMKKDSSVWKGSDGSGRLTIFKLYANLPMNEQMFLFNNPKDNERICILSTNIAETSITLPNIRYVVDCGKEKRKVYSALSDYSYYIIDNISKSSSLQRKGRAGRILHLLKNNKKNKKKIETEKGHVYKLYSSNYYNYFFKNHNDFPILNYPLDSLILYLLSFKIENVENFPFINKPDKYKFQEAKKRLMYLNCTYFEYKDIEFLFKSINEKMASKKGIENHIKKFNPQNKKGITLVGSFILSLPISTRYAKILTDVCLKSLSISHASAIPLACLLVSCLYLESIFSYDYKLSVRYRNKEKKKETSGSNIFSNRSDDQIDNRNTHNATNSSSSNLLNLFFKERKEVNEMDYTSSSSANSEYEGNSLEENSANRSNNIIEDLKLKFNNDIDFYLYICTSFYFSKKKDNFCNTMQLDKKKMNELLKLSNHLIKIINYKLNKNITFDILEKQISDLSKKIIYYAVIQGFIDHLAIRSDLINNDYTRNSKLNYNNKKAYFTQNMNTPIYINSSSVLYKNRYIY